MNNVDFNKEPQTILSLCSGGRGLDRGLERAFESLRWAKPNYAAYVEINAFEVYNMVAQMEQGVLDEVPIWTDVKTFPARYFHGKVHGIIGGYPCQPFSHVGRQKGTEDPRHLWPYIKKIIRTVGPRFCFFENVSNHLNIGYEQVRNDLQELGYTVKQGLFSAEEVGAPHIRRRLFVLALDHTSSGRYGIKEREICTGRLSTESTGSELDNSVKSRLEGYPRNGSGTKGRTQQSGPVTPTMFPMGQGYNQHDWEAQRIVSRLDLTINGYDYTTDLLRMAGNGVVEQTAELAFITLLKELTTHK